MMIRVGALVLVALCTTACGSSTCSSGQLTVNVTFDNGAEAADSLTVNVLLDGSLINTTVAEHAAGVTSEPVQVDFNNGYPVGHEVQVGITATLGTATVASGTVEIAALGKSCATVSLDLSGTTFDLGAQVDQAAATDL